MLRNYLTIAYRHLLKNKVFSFINILGLSIGMAASFFILQYVSFELSYDDFHSHAQDTYRVTMDIYKNGEQEVQSARVAPGVAAAFETEFSEIENYTRLLILGPDAVLTYQDRYVGEEGVYLADSAFFEVFSYDLLYGNEETALSEPFSVIITQSTAQMLFEDENPVGQEIVMNASNFDGNSIPFKVSGVIKDFPANTHLKPAVLISYPTLFEFVGHQFDESWTWNETYTYFKLQPSTDPQVLSAEFPEVVHRFNKAQLDEQKLDWQYQLQPITDIHLYSDLQHELAFTDAVNGSAFYVYFLAVVGLMIILIAYINFINLVTVKALNRAKEVGIRKVSGAHHSQLIFQFFLESLLVNVIAIILSVTLLQLGTPYFSALFDVKLTLVTDSHPLLLASFGIFVLLLVLGSGFYPAFVLARYQPDKVLKGSISKGKSGAKLRKLLVTAQFAIAIVLIALTLTAGLQIRYMQQQSLGFEPEQMVVVKGPKAYDYGYENNFSAFQNKLSSLAQVNSVSGAIVVPGQEIYHYNAQVMLNGEQTSGVFALNFVAPNYFSHYGIPLVGGRVFREEEAGQPKWVINEAAMKLLGFDKAEEALMQTIDRNGQKGEIIGVVKDFHHQSLKEAISPTLFYCSREHNYYSVKVENGQLPETLKQVQATYMDLFPGSPYEYFFLDEFFNRQYQAEQQFNIFFRIFSGLAIFIACLGLFGLSAFMATQRTKEIGIRKVLGASVSNILGLLSRDFMKLVLIAGIPALPLAYWAMHEWLQNYAFRIDISWWLLAIPLALVLFLALITVSVHTLKAAYTNPSKSLRYE
ncbi:ABC transporter permease [Catalinimonas niigatensis]|uniref:ABC transporter permease n=1 Tax=Catalinimonas niigatensis TaxID=1397264 RepID=UPI002666C771|nr:ABC transporter permease [Catalinimonas niigatensis]WPP51353.1 ABC transporter permease [Catalinimonas niigatensis]